ncbi:hypothetical protein SNEBB_008278, partial [Seison nebaliae]
FHELSGLNTTIRPLKSGIHHQRIFVNWYKFLIRISHGKRSKKC